MHEQQVTLHLVVELVRYLNAAYVIWARFGPLPADLTRLHNLWDEFQDRFGNADSVKEPFHHMLRGMPPPNMELPQGQPDGTLTVGTEQADHTTNIEVGPIVIVLGSNSSVSNNSAFSLFSIRSSMSELVWGSGFRLVPVPGS